MCCRYPHTCMPSCCYHLKLGSLWLQLSSSTIQFPVAGLKAAVSAALAMSSDPRPGSAASDAAASADCRRTASNDADALAAQMHSMAVTVSRI